MAKLLVLRIGDGAFLEIGDLAASVDLLIRAIFVLILEYGIRLGLKHRLIKLHMVLDDSRHSSEQSHHFLRQASTQTHTY